MVEEAQKVDDAFKAVMDALPTEIRVLAVLLVQIQRTLVKIESALLTPSEKKVG